MHVAREKEEVRVLDEDTVLFVVAVTALMRERKVSRMETVRCDLEKTKDITMDTQFP